MSKADAATDYLILKGANAQGELPSQLAIMKLLFFVEGWSYALLGRSILQEPIEAWKLGPVVPTQRQRLKQFGAAAIPRSFVQGDPANDLDADELAVIDNVWHRYAIENPGTLVGLTHLRGSPWHIVRKDAGIEWDAPSTILIPPDLIRNYFCGLYEEARRMRIAQAIEANEKMTLDARTDEQAALAAEWNSRGEEIAWVARH